MTELLDRRLFNRFLTAPAFQSSVPRDKLGGAVAFGEKC